MSFALPVITLVNNVSQSIGLTVNPDLIEGINILNESPYPIQYSGFGQQLWIAAWGEERGLKSDGSTNEITLVPASIATIPQIAQSSSVLITVFVAGDILPPRQTLSHSRQVSLSAINLTYKQNTAAAGAACAVTLPASAGATAYIKGIWITTGIATANTECTLTFSNQQQLPTLYYVEDTGGSNLYISFEKPVKASGLNVALTVTLSAGVANRSILIWGYYQ